MKKCAMNNADKCPVVKSMGSKEGNMKDKEMDTVKKTQRRRPIPHQRGGSNTASLRTPKNTSISFGGERGWSAVKSLPSRKYDISTLMAIGRSGGMDSIVARFSSHSVESKDSISVSKPP